MKYVEYDIYATFTTIDNLCHLENGMKLVRERIVSKVSNKYSSIN